MDEAVLPPSSPLAVQEDTIRGHAGLLLVPGQLRRQQPLPRQLPDDFPSRDISDVRHLSCQDTTLEPDEICRKEGQKLMPGKGFDD